LGYICAYHGNGANVHSLDGPAPTIPTHDSCALVVPQWLDKCYSGSQNHQNIDQPSGTVMSKDKYSLVTVSQFVYDHQYGNSARSLDQPSQTLIASMKRKPPYLLTALEVDGQPQLAIPVFDTDTEWSIKIKEFMVLYGIVDIKMRMLKVSELMKIQGFPEGYILEGTQADQKKFIGNSVVPLMAKALIVANAQAVGVNRQEAKTA
jgi:DNA (cytosine-5)-methyltransferase 1